MVKVVAFSQSWLLYGFAKNQRDNIDAKELHALKVILKVMASHLLEYDNRAINKAIKAQELIEVVYVKT